MKSVRLLHVSAPGCLPQGVVSWIVFYDLDFVKWFVGWCIEIKIGGRSFFTH